MANKKLITVEFFKASSEGNSKKEQFYQRFRLGETGRMRKPQPLAGLVSLLLGSPKLPEERLAFYELIPATAVSCSGRVHRCFCGGAAHDLETGQVGKLHFCLDQENVSAVKHPGAYLNVAPGIHGRTPSDPREAPKLVILKDGAMVPELAVRLGVPPIGNYFGSAADPAAPRADHQAMDRFPRSLQDIALELRPLLATYQGEEIPPDLIECLPTAEFLPKLRSIETKARERFTQESVVVSGLSWLGLLVAELLFLWANHLRLRQCVVCESFFVPQPQQMGLCSPACVKRQNTVLQRRRRVLGR